MFVAPKREVDAGWVDCGAALFVGPKSDEVAGWVVMLVFDPNKEIGCLGWVLLFCSVISFFAGALLQTMFNGAATDLFTVEALLFAGGGTGLADVAGARRLTDCSIAA
jgi:hypothetical protein